MLSPSCLILFPLAAAGPRGDGVLYFTQVADRFECLELRKREVL